MTKDHGGTQRRMSCVPLTRLERRSEDIPQRLLCSEWRCHVGQFRKVAAQSVLFTLRDPHPLLCASHLALVNSQAVVGRRFGPAAAAANLEVHV